ncbi:glycosyltransferase [Streptococcus suis]
MKILMINSVCGIRSTGRICTDLAEALTADGHIVKIAYGREHVPEQYKSYAVQIGSPRDVRLHALRSRLLDESGFGSKKATLHFIERVKEFNPDVIHLHNIHGYYINVEVLFAYLRTCGKKILWTLHDCWAFTGHSAYFDSLECEERGICYHPSQKNDYPKSLINLSARNYEKKKNCFTAIPNLTIITPSHWLANLVKRSFLREYPVQVVHNGINTDVFYPRTQEAQVLKRKFSLEGKQVLLGVAAIWDKRKGLSDMLELAGFLKDNQKLVLIGLTEKQLQYLPENIVGISETDSASELAVWYTVADVFLNPTYQDNYPTTNIESIACGTPVITYPTGGSVESACLYGLVCGDRSVSSILESLGQMASLKKTQKLDLSVESFIHQMKEFY